ncbi:MAG TPA: prenyltransferase [Methanocella sp.]|jgi:1,4-dihydroxy-2-naphthoate octaprenyltransferase
MLSKAGAWVREFRVLFLFFAAVPLAMGSAVAYRYYPGQFSWPYFFLSLAAILLLHAGTIAFNDYFDFRSGADTIRRERTPFTGGTGLLPAGILKPWQVLAAGSLCFALCIAIGLFIVFTRSPIIFLFGVAGVGLGIFYTAPPLKLAYRLLGEITWLSSFPLTALGALFVQSPAFGPGDILAMLPAITATSVTIVPVALLATAGLLVLELPDYDADREARKVGIAVLAGKKATTVLFVIFCIVAFGWLVMTVITGFLSTTGLLALAGLPVLAWVGYGLVKHGERPAKLIPHIATGAATIYMVSVIVLFSLLF